MRIVPGLALAAALSLAGCGERAAEPGANAVVGNAGRASAAAPAKTAAPAPANAAAPKAPPTATGPFSPTGYALNGTEPFWGGTVTGTSIRYMTPEDQFGDVIETTRSYGPGREVYTGALGGRPFVLTLVPGPCSNGMSDHSYAFTAELQVRGEARRGCADPQ